jgi:hypothetical protein
VGDGRGLDVAHIAHGMAFRLGHSGGELRRLNGSGGRQGRLGCGALLWRERRGGACDSTAAGWAKQARGRL